MLFRSARFREKAANQDGQWVLRCSSGSQERASERHARTRCEIGKADSVSHKPPRHLSWQDRRADTRAEGRDKHGDAILVDVALVYLRTLSGVLSGLPPPLLIVTASRNAPPNTRNTCSWTIISCQPQLPLRKRRTCALRFAPESLINRLSSSAFAPNPAVPLEKGLPGACCVGP